MRYHIVDKISNINFRLKFLSHNSHISVDLLLEIKVKIIIRDAS